MLQLILGNRWFALIWVLGTLGSVAAFVGKDGAAEQLGKRAESLRAQQEALTAEPAAPIDEPAEEILPEPAPDQFADPGLADEGEIFINPETGQRVRIVRRSVTPDYAPASIDE